MKVAKKKLFGLTSEALKELERRVRDGRVTQTQALHDALLGKHGQFNPHVESGIKNYQKRHDCTRHEAIEGLLSEALLSIARRGPYDHD